MTIQTALSFYFIVMVFALTPGPGVVALIARVLNQGWSVFIPLGLGMCLGDACYILLTVFGLSKLAASWGAAFLAVRLLGAAYFIYLGYKMWTSKARAQWGAVASTHTEWLETLLQGFLIAISNPKVILFYVAFLPTLLNLTQLTMTGVVLALLITALAVMSALGIVAAGAGSLRQRFKSESAQIKLNRASGSIMVFAGLYIGLRA